MKTGIELIAQERKEQIEKHGRTVSADVEQNQNNQLRRAAQFLLEINTPNVNIVWALQNTPINWDDGVWLRMCRKPYKERLIIAGALIAAEIDRLNAIEP